MKSPFALIPLFLFTNLWVNARQGEWTPIFNTKDSIPAGSNATLWSDGTIHFNGKGVLELPGFSGKDVALKAKVLKERGQNLTLRLRVSDQGKYVAYYNGSDVGIGLSKAGKWSDITRTRNYGSKNTEFVEMEFRAVGNQLSVLVNGKEKLQASRNDLVSSGTVAISNMNGPASFREVQVLTLSGGTVAIPTPAPQVPAPSPRTSPPPPPRPVANPAPSVPSPQQVTTTVRPVQVNRNPPLTVFPPIERIDPNPGPQLTRHRAEIRVGIDKEGFVALFNGYNLDGWKQQAPGHFRVDNGNIVADGRAGRSQRSMMYYDGKYNGGGFRNFEFRVQVKMVDGGNSGIYFRTRWKPIDSPTGPAHARMYPDEWGYEAQIASIGHRNRNKTGSLLRINSVSNPPVQDGEWFDYHVIANKRQIELKINGRTMSSFIEPEAPNQRRPQGEKLALQCHEPGYVLFRDVKIKVLE